MRIIGYCTVRFERKSPSVFCQFVNNVTFAGWRVASPNGMGVQSLGPRGCPASPPCLRVSAGPLVHLAQRVCYLVKRAIVRGADGNSTLAVATFTNIPKLTGTTVTLWLQ